MKAHPVLLAACLDPAYQPYDSAVAPGPRWRVCQGYILIPKMSTTMASMSLFSSAVPTSGSLMDRAGHECGWIEILVGFAALAELPSDVTRQQVDREQVSDVDRTAVAVQIAQVGVGHV